MTKEEVREQIKDMEEKLEELEMIRGFLTLSIKIAKGILEDLEGGKTEEKDEVPSVKTSKAFS